jgi:hypothetical protein
MQVHHVVVSKQASSAGPVLPFLTTLACLHACLPACLLVSFLLLGLTFLPCNTHVPPLTPNIY